MSNDMDDQDAAKQQRQTDARERIEEGVKERLLERRAREREEARRAGRPERGFFTGFGGHGRDKEHDDDAHESRNERGTRRNARDRDDRESNRPRTGAKRSVMRAIRQLPSYFRLLVGLISDGRVSKLDKFFVLAAAAYIISPIDFIPDVIPFFGEVDDVFFLMIALQRLVNNAGRSVLLSHWRGDPDEVHNLNFARIVSAAGFFLPARLKRRLFKMAGGKLKQGFFS